MALSWHWSRRKCNAMPTAAELAIMAICAAREGPVLPDMLARSEAIPTLQPLSSDSPTGRVERSHSSSIESASRELLASERTS
jgi:hypothetical protein